MLNAKMRAIWTNLNHSNNSMASIRTVSHAKNGCTNVNGR